LSLLSSPVEYSCTLTDEARPFEPKRTSAEDAKEIYQILVAAGMKEKAMPFFRGNKFFISAPSLSCSKSGNRYNCSVIKPLIEKI
jgi:hypothetical protein